MRFLPDSQFTEALHSVAPSLETRNVSMHSQEECIVFLRGGPRRFATAATDHGRRMTDDDVVNGKLGPIVYFAAGLRSFVVGFTGVALGLYLAALGYDPALVGGVVASGLAGNAVGVALVAGLGERLGRRRTLIGASVLGAAGLGALAAAPPAPFVVGLAAFLGMVNGMGRDRGPAQALEQSVLADAMSDAHRTTAFVRYRLGQCMLGACGSLAAAVPTVRSEERRVGKECRSRWSPYP